MENKKQYFTYLGGHHKQNGDWREEFNEIAQNLTSGLKFGIWGIDPFKRNIDEADCEQIVGRDFSIIIDSRLNYVVLRAMQAGSILSTGATCEKMLGFYLSKPVIIISEPEYDKTYPSSDAHFEKWHHPFVEVIANIIVPNIEGAVKWIISDIIKPTPRINWREKIGVLSRQYRFGQGDDIDPFEIS